MSEWASTVINSSILKHYVAKNANLFIITCTFLHSVLHNNYNAHTIQMRRYQLPFKILIRQEVGSNGDIGMAGVALHGVT